MCSQPPYPTPVILARIPTHTHTHMHTHSCSLLKENWNHELRHVSPFFISSMCHLGPHEGYFFLLLSLFSASFVNAAMRGSVAWTIKKKESNVREEVLVFANCQGVGSLFFSFLVFFFLAVCSFVLTPPPLMWSELNNVATQMQQNKTSNIVPISLSLFIPLSCCTCFVLPAWQAKEEVFVLLQKPSDWAR